MDRILPAVLTLVAAQPARTVFTRFIPPGRVVDKLVCSPWRDGLLRGAGVTTQILTGGETNICVLATVMGAGCRRCRR